jgi:hypothetical protein
MGAAGGTGIGSVSIACWGTPSDTNPAATSAEWVSQRRICGCVNMRRFSHRL